MAKDEDFAEQCLVPQSSLQKEVEALSVIVKATTSIKQAAAQLTNAARS